MHTTPAYAIALLLIASVAVLAKDDAALKDALHDELVSDEWIYDDIEAGYAAARKTGRPLLVSFRCVP